MSGELKPYPKYKESGLAWIGKVPEHWLIDRVKWHLEYKKKINFDYSNKNVLSLTLRGVVNNDPSNPEGLVPKDYRTYQYFERGDFVFKLIDLENLRTSRVGIAHENGIMSSAYIRMAARNPAEREYLFAMFRDLYNRGIYNQLGAGVRSTLGPTDLQNLSICIPTPAEQAAIAKYLAHATTAIDKAIAAKKKVIGLLEEEKRAIIQKAVTKGLDPNAKMKDSGVPWIGEIPEGWSCVRNLALFANRVEHGIPGLPIFQVSLHSGVTEEPLDQFGREKWLINNQSMYKLVRLNDIAYNTMRMWQGAVGVVPKDGLVSPAYVVLRPRDGVFSKYYELLFRTGFYKGQMNRFSTGIVSDRNRLYWDSFKQMPNLLIPEPEQKRIVAGINKLLSPVLLSIEKTDAEISLLREYRTRLVADVVTGKLDVRKAAEGLPEVDEVPVELVEEEGEIEDEEAEEA